MNIGLTRKSYPEKRCITTSADYNYIYARRMNLLRYLKKIPVFNNKVRDFVFVPFYDPRIDIYHTFNDICITNKKWVVTFETMLPRFLDLVNYHREETIDYPYNSTVNYYLQKLAAPNCLGVIALSQSTYNIQKKLLMAYPLLEDKILSKTTILYPPQLKLVDESEIENKNYKNLKLIFVGRDFYRKGGSEVVLAVNELLIEKKITAADIEVTFVGDLNKTGNYVLDEFADTPEYFKEILNIIDANSNMKVIPEIKNEDLLQILKDSHIGLLPTWADTFGYSVLEFQACGCPVISTDVRALSEINNNESGWLINIEKNSVGEVVIDSYQKKETVRRLIVDNLKSIIVNCVNNKESIRLKAQKSLNRIETQHSFSNFNKKLSEIYLH